MKKNCMVVGIAGASGSGKTLLAEKLAERSIDELGEGSATIIGEDSYYRDLSHLTFEERTTSNFDHPDALETELLREHLSHLLAGQDVEIPRYDFARHVRMKETRNVTPTQIVLIEGILLLHDSNVSDQFDLKVYVDVDQEICLTRRLKRDLQQRGRDLDSVLQQYQESVRPMFLQFVQPTRELADIVVPHGGENQRAVEVLFQFIKSRVSKLTG